MHNISYTCFFVLQNWKPFLTWNILLLLLAFHLVADKNNNLYKMLYTLLTSSAKTNK